jgi:hypothetical protein
MAKARWLCRRTAKQADSFGLNVQLNRVHFENRGYASPEPGNTPVHGASGQNFGTTVSKLDAV